MRAVVPGPTVAVFTQWIGLFYGTVLTLPKWEITASKLALAIGSALTVIASLLLKDLPKSRLWGLAGFFSVVFLMGILACLYYRHLLQLDPSPSSVLDLQNQWMYAFVCTMVSLILAITLGALSLEERVSSGWRVFWSVCAIAGILLLTANVALLVLR